MKDALNQMKNSVSNGLQELAENVDDFCILFEVAYRPSNFRAYYLIPTDVKITDSLKDKAVIEYPEFIIVPRTALASCQIVSDTSDASSFEARTVLEQERHNVIHGIPFGAELNEEKDDAAGVDSEFMNNL